LHGWVFTQDQVWLDSRGREHDIDQMTREYVGNVIAFCERQAERIRLIVDADEIDSVLRSVLLCPSTAARWRQQLERVLQRQAIPALEWLGSTPLLKALRRRVDPAEA
jgi:hypothetical protein